MKSALTILLLAVALLAGCSQATTTATVAGPTTTTTATSVVTTTLPQASVTVSLPPATTTVAQPPVTVIATQLITTTTSLPPQTVTRPPVTVTATPPPATTAVAINDFSTVFPATGTLRAGKDLEGKMEIRFTDFYILPNQDGQNTLNILVAIKNTSQQNVGAFSFSYTIRSGSVSIASDTRAFVAASPATPLLVPGGMRIVALFAIPLTTSSDISAEVILESAAFS